MWPAAPTWVTAPYPGRGRPPEPQPQVAERQEARARAAALPQAAWQVLTVAEGAQGPRVYRFAGERVCESRDGKPGTELWLLHKENLDGTEPRTFYSNAPAATPLATLARVAMGRWPVETELENDKSQVALDEYEVRGWPGWQHHLTMCFLAAAFLLTLQQDWGEKDAPHYAPTGASDRLRTAAAKALHPGQPLGMVGAHASA